MPTPSATIWWLALCLSGCHHDSFIDDKRDGSSLDKMELTAAKRVGLASAADAMRARDLGRLKLLSTWVRRRAQVVLLEPDDLAALDLAIACLDGSSAESDRAAAFARIESSKLLEPTRTACSPQAEPADDQ